MPISGHRARTVRVLSALVVGALLYCALHYVIATSLFRISSATASRLPADPRATDPTELLAAGKHHKRLKMWANYRGRTKPKFRDIQDVTVGDDAPVIGLVLDDGKAYAFERRLFLTPEDHVLNFVAGDQAVSVTYCTMSDCTRVFASDQHESIAMNVGGLDIDNQMVVLLNGVRYGQTSPDIPLSDLPYEVTTLGQWRAKYPGSKIYTRSRL